MVRTEMGIPLRVCGFLWGHGREKRRTVGRPLGCNARARSLFDILMGFLGLQRVIVFLVNMMSGRVLFVFNAVVTMNIIEHMRA